MGKIFVGGLTRATSEDVLRSHFQNFGKIADCVVMRDKITNAPRGFGFVVFGDPSGMLVVLETLCPCSFDDFE